MTRKNGIRLIVLAALLGGIAWAVAYRDELTVEALRMRMDALGVLAPLAFVAAYAAAAVLFLPGSVFTIAGGVLFGPWQGALLGLAGATLGAAAAFFTARYLASDWVARRAGGRLQRLVEGVEEEGWRFVAFVRLVPVFPFNLLNYALGLTRISWVHYLVASFVCMAPGAFAYAWIGHAGASAVTGGEGAVRAVLVALGLVATVAFLPRLVRRVRGKRPRRNAGGETA